MRLACALVFVTFIACGDDSAATRDTSSAPDAATATEPDSATATEADVTSADTWDPNDSTADVEVVEPVACADGEACTDLLDEEARCPAICMPVPDALACEGTVVNATCRVTPVIERGAHLVDFGDFTVEAPALPDDAQIGDRYIFALVVKNKTANELTLPLSARFPDAWTWDIPTDSWPAEIIVPPNGQWTSLIGDIESRHPTMFQNNGDLVAQFDFGERRIFQPGITVHFTPSEPIVCGGEHFPETYCPTETCYPDHFHYEVSVCCDDVFYPGADCCSSDDCDEGACVDGHCTAYAPTFPTANTLPLGNQRVLLVLVDSHPELAGDPCGDRSADLAETLQLPLVDAFYDDLGQRRLGKKTMTMKWTVLAGIATTDFLGASSPTYPSYFEALDDYLAAQGCPMRGNFEKILVDADTIDLQQYGGLYFGQGEIGVHDTVPYLLAHELGHSFGANDRYLDLGGFLQHAADLMGNALGPDLPRDGVMWGEVGFADLDQNGVIDIAEQARRPTALALIDPVARITDRDTLQIDWQLGAVDDDGQVKRIVADVIHIRVPLVGFDTDSYGSNRDRTLVFDESQLDLDALAAAGTLEFGISLDYRYVDDDWQPVDVTLQQTLQLPVVDERPQ